MTLPKPPKPNSIPMPSQYIESNDHSPIIGNMPPPPSPQVQYLEDSVQAANIPKPTYKRVGDTVEIKTPSSILPQEVTISSHNSIYDQVISSTLKPEHATDPNILRFISNYAVCKDVKQAAKEAGLSAIDGRRLISYPDIYDCVSKIANMNARKYGYDAEEVVQKVKEVLEFDPVDLFNPATGGYYEDLNEIPPETRRVIKKLNVMNVYEKDPNGVITGISGKILKFEFWDKLKAAEMLGSEKDVFSKKVEVKHDVGVNMRETLLGRIKDAEERRALVAKDVTEDTHE